MNVLPRKGRIYWVYNDPQREPTKWQLTGVLLAHWDGSLWMPVDIRCGAEISPLGGVTHWQALQWPIVLPPKRHVITVDQTWYEVS